MARLPSLRVRRRGKAARCEKATWLDEQWASPSAAQTPFSPAEPEAGEEARGDQGTEPAEGGGTRDTCTAEAVGRLTICLQ